MNPQAAEHQPVALHVLIVKQLRKGAGPFGRAEIWKLLIYWMLRFTHPEYRRRLTSKRRFLQCPSNRPGTDPQVAEHQPVAPHVLIVRKLQKGARLFGRAEIWKLLIYWMLWFTPPEYRRTLTSKRRFLQCPSNRPGTDPQAAEHQPVALHVLIVRKLRKGTGPFGRAEIWK